MGEKDWDDGLNSLAEVGSSSFLVEELSRKTLFCPSKSRHAVLLLRQFLSKGGIRFVPTLASLRKTP